MVATIEDVRRLRAREEVSRIDYLRGLGAVLEGHSQMEVARGLGISQPAVSQSLRAVRRVGDPRPGFSGASVGEVIDRYVAGLLSREQVVDELGRWDYAPRTWRPSSELDAYPEFEPGTWDEVDRAHGLGLIDDAIYYAALELSTLLEGAPRREAAA
jgi:DNA-binding transcriptional regulator YdaS (Cro superfamily)